MDIESKIKKTCLNTKADVENLFMKLFGNAKKVSFREWRHRGLCIWMYMYAFACNLIPMFKDIQLTQQENY